MPFAARPSKIDGITLMPEERALATNASAIATSVCGCSAIRPPGSTVNQNGETLRSQVPCAASDGVEVPSAQYGAHASIGMSGGGGGGAAVGRVAANAVTATTTAASAPANTTRRRRVWVRVVAAPSLAGSRVRSERITV